MLDARCGLYKLNSLDLTSSQDKAFIYCSTHCRRYLYHDSQKSVSLSPLCSSALVSVPGGINFHLEDVFLGHQSRCVLASDDYSDLRTDS